MEKINNFKKLLYALSMTTFIFFTSPLLAKSNLDYKLTHLQQAYPDYIKDVNEKYITWRDGTYMFLGEKTLNSQQKLKHPTLLDQLEDTDYPTLPLKKPPTTDPGRVRYQPFFLKMYGENETIVKSHLTTLYWMPKILGKQYPLLITTINSVDKKLEKISNELELLVMKEPKFIKFLNHPMGSFKWRKVNSTDRMSMHAFGIAMDINTFESNYWRWDLEKNHKPATENTLINYKNSVPAEIVNIFEKHGFIWGGKWYHYDTMHFEYRPELF